jgi:2-C-methyl-D-erythritol 4-phosphate cytidylyltransferase
LHGMTGNDPEPKAVPRVALLLAAGSGLRLGAGEPKAFLLLHGVSMLVHSLRAMAASRAIDGVVVVVPPSWERRTTDLLAPEPAAGCVTQIVAGGRTRQESVRAGLEVVPEGAAVVLCHDAARPFASPGLFRAVVEALQEGMADQVRGAVPVVASPDTVKRLAGGRIVETLPRGDVAMAQTPQAFDAQALRSAHEDAVRSESPVEGTDDAMLLERAGFAVVVVRGEPGNFKITSPQDLARAEIMFAGAGDADG